MRQLIAIILVTLTALAGSAAASAPAARSGGAVRTHHTIPTLASAAPVLPRAVRRQSIPTGIGDGGLVSLADNCTDSRGGNHETRTQQPRSPCGAPAARRCPARYRFDGRYRPAGKCGEQL